MRLADLKKASSVAVHFAHSGEVDERVNTLGLSVLEGSVAEVKTDKELFSVVAEAMKFPDYFGNNWDALDECLSDLDWLPVDGYLLILRDAGKGWSRDPYLLGCFVTAWLESAEYWVEKQTPFHLIFVI